MNATNIWIWGRELRAKSSSHLNFSGVVKEGCVEEVASKFWRKTETRQFKEHGCKIAEVQTEGTKWLG